MIDPDFIETVRKAHRDVSKCPPPKQVIEYFDDLLGIIFPEFSSNRLKNEREVKEKLNQLEVRFQTILDHNRECVDHESRGLAGKIIAELPGIRKELLKDVEAMYMGDPAANSEAEVVRTYPGFYAIAAHRFAHCLVSNGINLIPRIISENAHRQTGIDIHPGAVIGEYLCIDHGTGIVIGETAEVGSRVKIYQGVTLGGLSVKKEDARKKRHPTIEDDVVLYAGATILGGDTVIGKGSVIGGNVWLTKSAPPGSKIYYQAKMTNFDGRGETDTITFK